MLISFLINCSGKYDHWLQSSEASYLDSVQGTHAIAKYRE